MTYNNYNVESPLQIVNSFANFFTKTFIQNTSPAKDIGDQDLSALNINMLHVPQFSESVVQKALKRLKPSMTAGPDSIYPLFF